MCAQQLCRLMYSIKVNKGHLMINRANLWSRRRNLTGPHLTNPFRYLSTNRVEYITHSITPFFSEHRGYTYPSKYNLYAHSDILVKWRLIYTLTASRVLPVQPCSPRCGLTLSWYLQHRGCVSRESWRLLSSGQHRRLRRLSVRRVPLQCWPPLPPATARLSA